MSWYLKNIPKVAHFYWDQECLPFLRYLTILTFSKLNPDWELRLWQPFHLRSDINITWKTDEHRFYKTPEISYRDKLGELSNLSIHFIDKNEKIVDAMSGVAFSDLLRWKLLYEQGGLWSDMDIVYLKPISEISENKKEKADLLCVICREDISFDCNFIGVLLSSPRNEYYKKILLTASEKFDPDLYQSLGNMILDSFFTKEFVSSNRNVIGNLSLLDFYIYQPNGCDVQDLFSIRLTKNFSCSVGIHWYAGSKFASEAIFNYNHENYLSFNTSMSKIIEAALKKVGEKDALVW